LESFRPTLDELRAGGGGRTEFVKRFDSSLATRHPDDPQVWGEQNITIDKSIGFGGRIEPVSRVRGHEIDMFGLGSLEQAFPGVAVEMEWNNKDPFFDRDLINFQALHREGAIAVGVIVTRGPELQDLISGIIRSKDGGYKYGASTTHWNKLIPRVDLGGGGECPLLLVGIEPERVVGAEMLYEIRAELDRADALQDDWRNNFDTWEEAKAETKAIRDTARGRLPPVSGSQSG